MVQTKAYWAEVSREEASLQKTSGGESFVFITSISDPFHGQVGGAVCEAALRMAATRIVDRSHRLSTADEIKHFHLEQARRTAECQAMATNRGGQTHVFVSKELAALGEA